MPLIKDLVEGNANAFIATLGLSLPFITFLLPLTGLNAFATIGLYLYFQYEHLFHSALVRCTPPPPDAHLPSHDEWVANGGMKSLPSAATSSDSECIICRDLPVDPMQISRCRHTFCKECIGAWHAQGYRSCPQCTILLWREEPCRHSQLERLVKFTAAVGLVGAPMTLFALYCCFAYFVFDSQAKPGIIQALLLLSFTALSALVLTMKWGGLLVMLEQRRTQGIKWWGGGADSELEQALRMSMSAMSPAAACWLLLVSLVCEVYLGRMIPMWTWLQAVVDAGGWQGKS